MCNTGGVRVKPDILTLVVVVGGWEHKQWLPNISASITNKALQSGPAYAHAYWVQ